METVLKFLRDLDTNNNKEWFTANKARYQEAQDKWNDFCLQLINEVGKYVSDALKKVPKDYPADAPYADWMRLRSYGLVQYVDDTFITSPDLAQRVAELFRTTHPFIDVINRAVDFEE